MAVIIPVPKKDNKDAVSAEEWNQSVDSINDNLGSTQRNLDSINENLDSIKKTLTEISEIYKKRNKLFNHNSNSEEDTEEKSKKL